MTPEKATKEMGMTDEMVTAFRKKLFAELALRALADTPFGHIPIESLDEAIRPALTAALSEPRPTLARLETLRDELRFSGRIFEAAFVATALEACIKFRRDNNMGPEAPPPATGETR